MSNIWGRISRQFRLRHGLSQSAMADLLGLSRSQLARCERNGADLAPPLQAKLSVLCMDPPAELLALLRTSVEFCIAPRALCRTPRLQLQVVSAPAIAKRPSIVEWIGRDLAGIATGVLEQILDDKALQRGIVRREIAGVVSTTASVLDTPEAPKVGYYRTTTLFFHHDGVQFNDSVAVPVSADEPVGFTPLLLEELGQDLFGDHQLLEAALQASKQHAASLVPQ